MIKMYNLVAKMSDTEIGALPCNSHVKRERHQKPSLQNTIQYNTIQRNATRQLNRVFQSKFPRNGFPKNFRYFISLLLLLVFMLKCHQILQATIDVGVCVSFANIYDVIFLALGFDSIYLYVFGSVSTNVFKEL